jgi:NhaP-type Na+/H+ or K+/H+ antiporter
MTWRMLAFAMPLSILGIALVGGWLLGLGVAAALLLGAALAPTDPVLAADVQVGPPRSGEEDEVRFTLTAEAGLNDGLAFPFVNLAVAFVAHGELAGPWLAHWAVEDVLWKLAAGGGVGWVVGRVLGWLTFRMPNRAGLSRTGEGFVALGITFLAYGLRICTRNNPAFRSEVGTESGVGPVSPCRTDVLRRHFERRWFITDIRTAMIS